MVHAAFWASNPPTISPVWYITDKTTYWETKINLQEHLKLKWHKCSSPLRLPLLCAPELFPLLHWDHLLPLEHRRERWPSGLPLGFASSSLLMQCLDKDNDPLVIIWFSCMEWEIAKWTIEIRVLWQNWKCVTLTRWFSLKRPSRDL